MAETINPGEVQFTYDITKDEMIRGMKFFDRKTKFNKRVLNTVLLSILAGIYTYDWFAGSSIRSMCVFIIGICIALIAVMWFNVYNRRRNLAAGSQDAGQFSVTVDSGNISMLAVEGTGKDIPPEDDEEETEETRLKLEDGKITVYRLEDMFIIFVAKEWLYIFPHRCMDGEQITAIDEIFKQALGERYKFG